MIRFLFLAFLVFVVNGNLRLQQIENQNIEVNISLDFNNNSVKISYLLSPPPGNYTAEYSIETPTQSINNFKKYLLKPLDETAYQYDGKKLTFKHTDKKFLKYYFDVEIPLSYLQDHLIVTDSKNTLIFHFNEQTFKKIIPKPHDKNYLISLSICSAVNFKVNGLKFYSFVDKKSNTMCIFKTNLSPDDIQKINVVFERPIIIASTSENQAKKPTPTPASSAVRNQRVEPDLHPEDTNNQQQTIAANPSQPSMSSETKITSNTFQQPSSKFQPCYTFLAENHIKCQFDSTLYPGIYYLPKNPYYYLMPQKISNEQKCIQAALMQCDNSTEILDVLNAFEIVKEIIETSNQSIHALKLRNVVDNYTKNSNYTNDIRLYYILLFYNVYFYNGFDVLKNVLDEYSKIYAQKKIHEILQRKKIHTDINHLVINKTNMKKLYISYEIKFSSKSNVIKIQMNDENLIVKKGTFLQWIAYNKDQKIDTIITPTTGEKIMNFDITTSSEILFLYPQWEEYLMIPTHEIRPEYQALLELNYGYTPLNRYRAFRTMIATGNPNLLATAVSLALDDSLPEIRNFGFERLDEVPDYQIRKVNDGILKGIALTDAFTRPIAYRNAERFQLPVKRPAISNQKDQDLYSDLLVMKQFEGLKATEMALESFIEGNTDPGLIWFLAETGEREILDLLLTFVRGIPFDEAFKRISIVYQALIFNFKQESNRLDLMNKEYISQKLFNAGMKATEVEMLWKNLEINIQLFKASFTN
ncbi:hypothetical protein JCM31826_07620 [Thermaurantimonas aggregans]|uniref:Uncharacterized protein n=1 Tax=Thermaurantimonas aggregans TaxID=2173829 RepID=A0A401XJW7_9FLAO|nr:hypothetical protein [Thermaurantimonas aggregans]MCX8148905.1 hypothetical protein [Thermaurantimonas aggregans]GCD77280.1 hypothetical protein JCM31826_07620 [Thermaurantimonas aggregans]